MKPMSYLLVLDGTAQSRIAANLSWNLAEKTGARVVAQHVIDLPAIWSLISCKSPGFIGSGVYMEARENVSKTMRSLADSLMLSYCSQVAGRKIDSETYIDEGDPAAEICKRAGEHDLLIVGRDQNTQLCEKLAQNYWGPILLVSATHNSWTKMQVCVESTDAGTLRNLSEFLKLLGLPKKLFAARQVALSDELSNYLRDEDSTILLWRQPASVQRLVS